jgi:predicted aspartyl protease
LKYNLPFTAIIVSYKGMAIEIAQVLVDTGSASTILSADVVAGIKIVPSPEDVLYSIGGIGGSEAVFSRRADYLQVGEHTIADFEVEIGGMDYGFEINGILGMDFLRAVGAIINLKEMTIELAG